MFFEHVKSDQKTKKHLRGSEVKYFRKWTQNVGDKGVTNLTTRDTDPGRKGVYSLMSKFF